MLSSIQKRILVGILISFFSLSLWAEEYKPFKIEPEYRSGHVTNKEFKVNLFASKKWVNNPISLAIDAKGRVYVAEIGRFRKGVPDTRQHNVWFLEETELISLPQRLKLYDKYTRNGRFKEGHFTDHPESLVWLEDSNGDGVADKRVVYDDDYSGALMGNGSSILFHPDGDLLYANIPDIWKVSDKDGDGKADSRVSLSYGYGLRMGVNGHDLHGLEWGVDGRLYFTNGDRGYDIKLSDGSRLYNAERGAVFRCEADGSKLEVFCTGNRNPQDIAFDYYGYMVSVDNNQGRGDRSRYYYVIEGGDYAWNSGFENKSTFLGASGLHSREGPRVRWDWKEERCWDKPHKGQPAFCIPSMFFVGSGPCGITMVPGMSFGKDYLNHYLFSDYSEGLYAFKVESDGAGLKVVNNHTLFKGGLVIDAEFSSDGKLYIADYVGTSNTKDSSWKGNIFLLHHPKHIQEASVRSADMILKKGFKSLDDKTLQAQLAHRDYRVRLFSQFELAWRGKQVMPYFEEVLKSDGSELSRLHALWGLGMLSRKYQGVNASILPYLKDKSVHIRRWATTILGESLEKPKASIVLAGLQDASSQVKGATAIALGKIGDVSVVPAIIEQLKINDNKDVYLRHFLNYGLSLFGHRDILANSMNNKSAAVRLGVLLSMTRLQDTRIGNFLNDSDPFIVEETIRAITRTNMVRALPALANHARKYHEGYTQKLPQYQFERIIQANMRLGREENANNLLGMVKNSALPDEARHLALCELKRWYDKQPLDPVAGQVRSFNFSRFRIDDLMKNELPALMAKERDAILDTLVSMAVHYKVKVDSEVIAKQAENERTNVTSRIAKLDVLIQAKYDKLLPLSLKLVKKGPFELRQKALATIYSINADQGMKMMQDWTKNNKEGQLVYATLKNIHTEASHKILLDRMQLLKSGKHPKNSQLDLILACEGKEDKNIREALKEYQEGLNKKDNLAEFRPMMYGGNKDRGRAITYNHGRAQCVVCHKIGRRRGGIVGPNLTEVATQRTDEHLMEALVQPSKFLAPGFGNITITLKNGKVELGSPFKEDKKTITLMMPDKSKKVIKKADIQTRGQNISTMPPMMNILKKDEIRDVFAYLQTLVKRGTKRKSLTKH